MAKSKRISYIFALIAVMLIGLIGMAACGEAKIDLTGYTKVTYDCMGGHIDKLPTRVLYAKPNTLIVEPKGSIGLVEAKRTNYMLVGWYTAHGEGSYNESTDGDYVYYYTFEKNDDGDFVKILYYYEDLAGKYVAQEVLGETVYVIADGNASGQKYSMLERYAPYDAEDETHSELERYKATAAYVLYDANNPDHQGLQRYLANYTWDEKDRWDFKTSRVGDADVTLYARWAYNLKIFWDYGTGTVYTYENGQLGIEIERGAQVPKTQLIPQKSGYTFTYWYKDKELTQKWDFATDVFPTDVSVTSITMYAGYIEGEYQRITTAKQFKEKIADKPTGKYLLVNDIDLGDTMLDFSKVKITATNGEDGKPVGTTFNGELNGLGNKITGIRINVKNTDSEKTGQVVSRYFGLFGCAEGATVKDVELEGRIVVDSASTRTVYIGTVLGRDKGGSKIENVKATFTLEMSSETPMESNTYISAGVARKAATTVESGCDYQSVDYLKNNISTTGTITTVE